MNPLPHPLYMLVADHRRLWTRWCDEHGIDHLRIREIKKMAADAFLLARRDSPHARESGVLLVDRQYGAEAFVRARAGGARVGTPAERDDVFPLEWIDRFERVLPGDFVKVCVRHHESLAPEVVSTQLGGLLDLHRWCDAAGKPFVIEVSIGNPTIGDPPSGGASDLLAEYIQDAYALGIAPQYWMLEAGSESAAMRAPDAAIRRRGGSRLLILADRGSSEAVTSGFEPGPGLVSVAGMAVGLAVYQEPASEFLLGRRAADDAVHAIAANYRSVIESWQRTATRFCSS